MNTVTKPKKAQGTLVEVGQLEFVAEIIVVTLNGRYYAGKKNLQATPQNNRPHWSLLHEGHEMGGVWKRGNRWSIRIRLDDEKYFAVKNETKVWKLYKAVFPPMTPMEF